MTSNDVIWSAILDLPSWIYITIYLKSQEEAEINFKSIQNAF